MIIIVFIFIFSVCVCDAHKHLRNMDNNSDRWDWRDYHPISSVDNELITNCSSSHIFAALGAIEALDTVDGNLRKISSQEYIDCSGVENSCELASVADVFKYYSNKEVCIDYSYKYNGKKNECQYNKCSNKIRIDKLNYNMFKGEEEIKGTSLTVVPTKIYIDSLKDYTGGIYSDYNACNHEPNHWVLVVGFGTEGNTKYWIIKNDFGEEWGENGYMRLERGRGMCGIGTESYAVYYSKWKTWLTVVIVVASVLGLLLLICCFCCIYSLITGSSPCSCCCCCCCNKKDRCIHPERVEVKSRYK